MKIRFYLHYNTQHGESLSIGLSDGRVLPLDYLNDAFWHGSAEIDPAELPLLHYHYRFHAKNGAIKQEWESRRSLTLEAYEDRNIHLFDYWNAASTVENVFQTQPFRNIFLKNQNPVEIKPPANTTHLFRVQAPLLKIDETPCLLGHGMGLRNWDIGAPILLQHCGDWWEVPLDLSADNFPLGYKYGVWNTRTNQFLGFEDGGNRTLYVQTDGESRSLTVLHDGFMRLPNNTWRGGGVAIPVFSLRSKKSWGVGEFADLPALADWAKSVGLKMIQLLPINDTSATGTWMDSYPYAAISAFALHPIFLNMEQVAGKAQAALLKPFAQKQKELNERDAVDYEAVLRMKWEIIRLLYAAQRESFLKDEAFVRYFGDNKHWLVPYAAFCYLKEKNGTADFKQWPEHGIFKEKEIEKLVSPKAKHFDEIALHYFVQWQLHLQLKAATDYAHAQGLAVKGDIPIGIYRYSCDAWMEPELYNMDLQAGAPPDDFAEKGQNWGFPTYNWERMQEDGFSWWRRRFQQMGLYFDAFRIDHILGFFRIWSIPMDAVQGILGRFVPAIPVEEREFHTTGIGFNYERLCRPYITDAVLWEIFGEDHHYIQANYLDAMPNGHWLGVGQYSLKPEFDTQRKVEAYFDALPASDENIRHRNGLYDLIANVILFEEEGSERAKFHFRFGVEKISSFQHLDPTVREKLKALYVNYFYRRQDAFWEQKALEKLPALKRSTNMLICGEDLGMVPDCVPGVMRELGFLSLEIQRMPKQPGSAFFHPRDAPYLSVVTPSTHDMSTIRGWWEEDRALTQRFYNEALGQWGDAPYFCEAWINRAIVAQHFHSPAMWSIFQLQDLLGIDGELRRENPADERINVPANPKHYWRYRMHLTLEELARAEGFNTGLRNLVKESGRWF